MEEEGRGGTGLTVRCRHQGLELLGLGRRLWPGAGSHGDLRSSSRPAAEKEKKRGRERLVNKRQCTCTAHWLDVWCAPRRKGKAADSDVNSLATPQQIEQGERVVHGTGWRGRQRCTVERALACHHGPRKLPSLSSPAGAAPSSKSA